jgi:ubiquitin-conjugating enzyme E2 N
LQGPLGTAYAEGIFEIELFHPSDYPIHPPIFRFIKKVWHPNICSKTGTLRTSYYDGWSVAMDLQTSFLHIQSLLGEPDLDNPRNDEAADMYKSNKLEFHKKAKQWVLESSHIEGHFATAFGKISFQTRDDSLVI